MHECGARKEKEERNRLDADRRIKRQGTWPTLVSRKNVESTSFSDPSYLYPLYAFLFHRVLASRETMHDSIDALSANIVGFLVPISERTRKGCNGESLDRNPGGCLERYSH